jgi:hypothetical protein
LKELNAVIRADNSRKGKFVIVEVKFLGLTCEFKAPRKELETILDRIADREARCAISPGDDLMFRVREALQRQLDRTSEKKPRGSQAARGQLVKLVKWAAPWTFYFLQRVCQPGNYYPPSALSADAKLRKKITGKLSPRQHAIYLTAILVSKAYPDWYRLDLQDPLSDPDDFEPENFYRVYISPHKAKILARIERNPKLLVPTRNAYLRNVFGF